MTRSKDPIFDDAVRAACLALGKDPDEKIWSRAYEDFLPPGAAVKMPRCTLVGLACEREFSAIIALVRRDEASKRGKVA